MTDARTWGDEADARTNAATGLFGGYWAGIKALENLSWAAEEEDVEAYVDALSVSARTDLPAATTALRAVLDLHAFVPARPGYHPDGCLHCQSPYPCPTVTTITNALEDA
ncbi:hypothetical protein [Oerskovia paurometabola]|uniref:hypothetical protein n=1 Tax=Oerskovia paurometabola TaxID=162170 RepID=UPI0037FF7465